MLRTFFPRQRIRRPTPLALRRQRRPLAHRRVNGTETAITPETVIPGATTNQAIRLIADITGTGPTTINARAPRPGTWQRTATDTSPTLQNPGAPGIATYLSSSTTNAPLTTTYDDYDVIGG